MTIFSTLIWNLLAPAFVSATMVGLARRLARAGWKARWGIAAGLGLGYFAGHWGILGRPPFPGVDTRDWIAWLVLAAALLGMIEAARSSSIWTLWGIRAVFVAGLLALVLRSKVEHGWA